MVVVLVVVVLLVAVISYQVISHPKGTMVHSTYSTSVWNEVSCHPSGASSFEVAHRFLEEMCPVG